jgi:sterol desaturase/sphingolipid hydroxylase (fatty acid hydroxylase superfamily)
MFLTTPGDLVRRVLEGLLDPLRAPFDLTRRTCLLYLGGAAMLAALVWWARGGRLRGLWGYLFPRRIWLHRSALLDYRLLFARAVLRNALLWPLAFSEVAVALAVASKCSALLAPPAPPTLGDAWVMALLSVCVFVAEDFARFLVHRAAHRVPALWELHKVHHSAEVMTPLTVGRAHPIESVVMRAGAQLAVGTTLGVFLWLFPGRVHAWELGGVYGLSVLWTFLGANLRHSHVWLSYGPRLEHVFISPAQHQIHHADRPEQCHSNYGSALALWDWAFGSLVVTTATRPPLRFGLPPGERNHDDTVASALFDPLWAALRTLRPRWRGRAQPG